MPERSDSDQEQIQQPDAGEAPDPATAPGGDGPDPEAIRAMREAVEARAREEEQARGGEAGDDGQAVTSSQISAALAENEAGDAELFKMLNRGELLYNHAAGCWLRWAGHHWEIDRRGAALAAAESVSRAYDEEARKLQAVAEKAEEDGERKAIEGRIEAIRRRAFKLRGVQRRRNVLTIAAASEDPLSIEGDEIDAKPWLLPCVNGAIDLHLGEAAPGRQDDYLMRAAPTEWRGLEYPCPRWDQFIEEVFEEDPHLTAFVRRLFGACLVGSTLEHVFPCLSGRGRNGKGTLLETIAHVLGELAGPIRAEMLLDSGFTRNSAGPSPDIMALRGMRLVWASETEGGAKLSSSRVKYLTGADTLRGRNPNDKYEITFKPSHSLFLLTNNLPRVPADDYAFWERVLVIPFRLSYVRRDPVEEFERKADPTLPEQLQAEASGILAWLVRGCIEWQREGLNPPEAVRAAVAQYRRDEDTLGDFIEECIEVAEGSMERAADLFDLFEAWWKKNVSNKVPKFRWFNKLLKARFETEKKGVLHFLGVRIRREAAAVLMELEG